VGVPGSDPGLEQHLLVQAAAAARDPDAAHGAGDDRDLVSLRRHACRVQTATAHCHDRLAHALGVA